MAKFAKFANISAHSEVHRFEKDLVTKLQNAFEFGGYFGTVIDIDGLTDVVTECHGFGLATKYSKDLLRKARHIIQLRIALRKSLSARNNDALWNIVVAVINNSILCDTEIGIEMGDNAEVIAANQNLLFNTSVTVYHTLSSSGYKLGRFCDLHYSRNDMFEI